MSFDINLASGQLVDGDVTVSNVNASVKNFQTYSQASQNCWIEFSAGDILEATATGPANYGLTAFLRATLDSSAPVGGGLVGTSVDDDIERSASGVQLVDSGLNLAGSFFDDTQRVLCGAQGGNPTELFAYLNVDGSEVSSTTAIGGIFPATASVINAKDYAYKVESYAQVDIPEPVDTLQDLIDLVAQLRTGF